MTDRKELIRTIYLYLFSLIGLVLVIMGLVRIVDLGLKVYVFKKADQILIYPEALRPSKINPELQETPLTAQEQELYEQQQAEYQTKQQETDRQRNAANALATIIVGTPIFLYHWKIIQKDKNDKINS